MHGVGLGSEAGLGCELWRNEVVVETDILADFITRLGQDRGQASIAAIRCAKDVWKLTPAVLLDLTIASTEIPAKALALDAGE